MLKTCAIIFGLILLTVGVLGFVPQATPHGHLFGIFHVNLEHNLIHIASGIIGILCGFVSEHASRLFFQAFGIIYGVVALLGFYYVDRPLFGVIAHNLADAFLHTAIAAISLYLGFGYHHPLHDRDTDLTNDHRI